MKQKHYIFGLIVIASAAVLYILWRENQAASGGSTNATGEPVPDAAPGAGAAPYPNSQPIQLGNITINDTPPNQNYNIPESQIPRVGVGNVHGCGCEDDDCASAGEVQTTQALPPQVLQDSIDNILSFQAKAKPVSNVEFNAASVGSNAPTHSVAPASTNGGGAKFSAA